MFFFTLRLRLGPLENHHLPDLLAAMNDHAIYSRLSRVPYPYTERDGKLWLSTLRAQGREDLPVHLGMVERSGGRLVGCISVIPGHPLPEIGYWVAPWAWGRGFAVEALDEVVEEADARGFPGVNLRIAPDNPASLRVAQRCGFTETGREILPYPTRSGAVEHIVLERWSSGP